MTDRNIKRFTRKGHVDDMGQMVKLWPGLEKNLAHVMRLQGYVPILDIVPFRGVSYDSENERFEYKLVIQGSYVGKRKAEQLEGLLSGKAVGKPTRPSKSEPSSAKSE